jgi:hypothetical protein
MVQLNLYGFIRYFRVDSIPRNKTELYSIQPAMVCVDAHVVEPLRPISKHAN